jgi:hypothetical protein
MTVWTASEVWSSGVRYAALFLAGMLSCGGTEGQRDRDASTGVGGQPGADSSTERALADALAD